MAETPPLTPEQLEAVFVGTELETGRGFDAEDSYDRQMINGDDFKTILVYFAGFEPVVRANVYANIEHIMTSRGTDALQDTELALLAWAPNDHLATLAAKEGAPGLLPNPAYYEQHVAHYGELDDARDAILKADGWKEPGFGGRALRVVEDLGTGGLWSQETSERAEGMHSLIGKAPLGGGADSRLLGILDTALLQSADDISEMMTTEQKVLVGAYSTGEVALSLFVVGSAVKSGAGWVMSGGPKLIASSPIVGKILQSDFAQRSGKFLRGLAGYGPTTRWDPATLDSGKRWGADAISRTFRQNMAVLSYRTGLPAEKLLQSAAQRQFKTPLISSSMYGKTASILSGIYLTSNVAEDILVSVVFADEIDALELEARQEQLEREGFTPADAKAKAIAEAEEEIVETLNDPLKADPIKFSEVTARARGETEGIDVTQDSPQMAAAAEEVFAIDEMTFETTNKVAKANEYETAVKVAAPRNRQAGEERAPVPDPDAIEAILTGEAIPSDFEEFITASEENMQGVMQDIGLEYFDPDVHGSIEEINAAAGYDPASGASGYSLIPDRTAPKSDPRMILLPPEISAAQFGDYYSQWVDENEIEDPFIRVPEGYSARTYQLKPKLGEIDRWEADFISRGQDSRLVYEQGDTRPAQFRESHVLNQINGMSYSRILEFQELAGQAGFYGESRAPFTEGYMTSEDQQIVAQVMGQANVDGENFFPMLKLMAENPGRYKDITEKDSGSTRVKDPYSIPLALRHIPGPKSIAEDVKARFARKLGREPLQAELDAVASDLSGYHTTQNQELIALDMARYDGDNQGMITGAQFQAIEDPGLAAQFDISEKWADEINLNERRESNSDSFGRMLNATLGGRSSIGSATAAGNVQAIGRAS